MNIKLGFCLVFCEECLMIYGILSWSNIGIWVKNICLEWFFSKVCFFYKEKFEENIKCLLLYYVVDFIFLKVYSYWSLIFIFKK